MFLDRTTPSDLALSDQVRRRGGTRPLYILILGLLGLTQIPVASAHDATAVSRVSPWHGLVLTFGGVGILGISVVLKRTNRLSARAALAGVFIGIVVMTVGAILFEGLSPDRIYSASSMPFPRSWYGPLSLIVGLLISVASFVVGWLRWPTRPRYTYLGILMGLWVAYPNLIPGPASDTHPLGYVIVLGTPVLVGYILWQDASDVLASVFRDPVARRFGIGVAIVLALFFVSITGYLSFFPEEGIPHEPTVVVLPVIYQLVTWPTLELYLPHIPVFVAVSPGQIIIVGLLSALIGLNAALIARHWRIEERAGMTEGTAGTAAIVGSCTCGCCGPLVAKIAVLAAGPSIAAPLYWVFVDSASPLSALFIVGSLVLFTGSLIYSIVSARKTGRSTSIVPAD